MRAFLMAAALLGAALMLAPERACAQYRANFYTPSNFGMANTSTFGPTNFATQPYNPFVSTGSWFLSPSPLVPSTPSPYNPFVSTGSWLMSPSPLVPSRPAPLLTSVPPAGTNTATTGNPMGPNSTNSANMLNGTTPTAGTLQGPNTTTAAPTVSPSTGNLTGGPMSPGTPGGYGTVSPGVTVPQYFAGSQAGIYGPGSYMSPFYTASPYTTESRLNAGYSPYTGGYPYNTAANPYGLTKTTTTAQYPSEFSSALRQVFPNQGY